MVIRDYMVYAGIRSSKRVSKLSWFHRDLFHGVLHACDDYGRFEVDVDELRSALYGLDLAKVSKRDVQDGLMRLGAMDVELVKYYTVRGKAFGKVYNYRQNGLRKRRALYPDEDGVTPEPELFPVSAVQSPPEERKKEEKSPLTPRLAGGCDSHGVAGQGAEPSEAGMGKRPRAPRRERRMPSIAAMSEELRLVEAEMTDILLPGGCAYKVTPQGDKAVRFARLTKQRAQLLADLAAARGVRDARDESYGLGADAA